MISVTSRRKGMDLIFPECATRMRLIFIGRIGGLLRFRYETTYYEIVRLPVAGKEFRNIDFIQEIVLLLFQGFD